jgi:hypothetical protein
MVFIFVSSVDGKTFTSIAHTKYSTLYFAGIAAVIVELIGLRP